MSMLPPLILELIAKTGEFKASMGEAGAAVDVAGGSGSGVPFWNTSRSRCT
ncbi:MAG TPA: hypothetical protein VHO26_06250 [Propionibacteriaceae bacterium]|nr:hypothetical protein [Propionibacteriaceae bacterium]